MHSLHHGLQKTSVAWQLLRQPLPQGLAAHRHRVEAPRAVGHVQRRPVGRAVEFRRGAEGSEERWIVPHSDGLTELMTLGLRTLTDSRFLDGRRIATLEHHGTPMPCFPIILWLCFCLLGQGGAKTKGHSAACMREYCFKMKPQIMNHPDAAPFPLGGFSPAPATSHPNDSFHPISHQRSLHTISHQPPERAEGPSQARHLPRLQRAPHSGVGHGRHQRLLTNAPRVLRP